MFVANEIDEHWLILSFTTSLIGNQFVFVSGLCVCGKTSRDCRAQTSLEFCNRT